MQQSLFYAQNANFYLNSSKTQKVVCFVHVDIDVLSYILRQFFFSYKFCLKKNLSLYVSLALEPVLRSTILENA